MLYKKVLPIETKLFTVLKVAAQKVSPKLLKRPILHGKNTLYIITGSRNCCKKNNKKKRILKGKKKESTDLVERIFIIIVIRFVKAMSS